MLLSIPCKSDGSRTRATPATADAVQSVLPFGHDWNGCRPFAVGDRVHVARLDSGGVIEDIGETHTIRAPGAGIPPDGEIRSVTFYDVRLDNGTVRQVADRDGHIVRA